MHKEHNAYSAEDIIKIILDESFYIHSTIGPGMFESVYQKLECGYRADIVVESKVIVDPKNVDAIADIHIAQMLTYLRFLAIRHGLILNFKTAKLKHGIRRVINGYLDTVPVN